MTSQEKTHDNQHIQYDLLVIPTHGITIAAPHLTDEQAAQAIQDWHNWGIEQGSKNSKNWNIAIAHPRGATYRLTTTITLAA